MIPYGRQQLDEDDIKAVVDVLKSDWLTTGPNVVAFEMAIAEYTDAADAVAVSSGTAALHTAMYAIGIGPGDEVIVPAMTFAATANCVVYQGGTPVFADVDPDTLLIDIEDAEKKITQNTKAIIAVDYAGQPCNYSAIRQLADKYGIVFVVDACHSLGARFDERKVGSFADMAVFSFHPVKHITTGEGGMVVTNNPEYAERMRTFRNHGISLDFRQRAESGTCHYDMADLGFNYRITDFQCALGLSQLKKLPKWLARRQEIARAYDDAFESSYSIVPLYTRENVFNAYHLYVVKLNTNVADITRDELVERLRNDSIGANVHYKPVHLHSFYRKKFGTDYGMCPVAEKAYEQILSLPIYPSMTDTDILIVVDAVFRNTYKQAGKLSA